MAKNQDFIYPDQFESGYGNKKGKLYYFIKFIIKLKKIILDDITKNPPSTTAATITNVTVDSRFLINVSCSSGYTYIENYGCRKITKIFVK